MRDNRKNIKKAYENTATYFSNTDTADFTVKCGVYEDDRALMEITISVDTREQARQIQSNWKKNANTLYGKLIETLIISPSG